MQSKPKEGILDVDLFPSGMKPTTGDKLNLSPRLTRSSKEPVGSLRGDGKPKEQEEKKSRNAGGATKSLEKQGSSHDSDSFFRMYNQEIKINQDEIPIILAELTDAAYNFISREQFEKALILLQKTEGVLECVSLADCSRDKFVTFITYNNMAMCFQKLNMLEECLTYLKESIKIVQSDDFLKGGTVSLRMKRLKHECKLKLQLCAILSQTQSHTEAQNNALSAVKLCHQLFKDLEELCGIYSDKITYRDNLLAAQEQSDLDDEEREQYIAMILDSSPAKEIPKNFLERSISLVERSSLKLAPVVKEVRKRMAGEPYVKDKVAKILKKDTSDMKITENKGKEESKEAARPGTPPTPIDDEDDEPPDMRSVLGFLNQQEWIANLNIGNIMQIQALQMKDFLNWNRDEVELSRDQFLEKLSILTVSYFCMSTEMRFLLQLRGSLMKPSIKHEKELESEYWHAKALEMACTFLPSECPLLNHILLSYQKHHDPAKQPIREDEEATDMLSVLRPIRGIDQSKYQPIIRQLPITVKVSLSPASVGVGHGLRTLLQSEERSLVARVLKNHLQTTSMSQAEKGVSSKLNDLSKSKESPQASKTTPVVDSQSPMAPVMENEVLKDSQPHFIPAAIAEEQDLSRSQASKQLTQFNIAAHQAAEERKSPKYVQSNSSLHASDDEAKDKMDAALIAAVPKGHSRDQPSGALNDISAISKQSNLYHLRSNSIEGLERQLMQVAESPQHNSDSPIINDLEKIANVDWLPSNLKEQMKEAVTAARRLQDQSLIEEKGFNSQIEDSLPQVDSMLLDQDSTDTRIYDAIISKLLENPRIDKKTLLTKFISKLECESKKDGEQSISQQLAPQSAHSFPHHSNTSLLSQNSSKEDAKHHHPHTETQQSRVEKVPLSDESKRLLKQESAKRKSEDSVILPQTRIRKRAQKPSTQIAQAAISSANTSKASNLSKTTGQKTLKQEQRLSNTNARPTTKPQLKRPNSRLVKDQQKSQNAKTRKMISYLERDQFTGEEQSFEEENSVEIQMKSNQNQEKSNVNFYQDEEAPMLHVEDIELQEKSEQSRSRVENQSILTIGDNIQGEQLSRIEPLRPESAEKEQAADLEGHKQEQKIVQELSSQKKSSKTRPSSGPSNFTRSSSNMKHRRRQAATSLVPGVATVSNQYKRPQQRVQPRAVASKVDGSRSSSSQRRSKASQNVKQTAAKRQLKRTSGNNTNSNSTATVPVQKFLQEQNSVLLPSTNNKENFSVIANTRGALQGHQTSQQVLPPKGRPISGNKTTGLRPKHTSASVFEQNQTAAQHNLSQQCLPSHKQNQIFGGSSQKRLRLVGAKNNKIEQPMARAASGAAIPGYKTAQPRLSLSKQKGSGYNSAAVASHLATNQLSQTKPHSQSQALGKNQQLYAQLSHHLQLSGNQRGRSRKRKRVSGINATPNLNSVGAHHAPKMQTRGPILQRARSGGSYSHSTGRGTVSDSSRSKATSQRCFACSNSNSNKKRHQTSESRSRSNPRNKSSRSDQNLRYSSKRRSGNRTAQENKAHQLEFKKQPGGAVFNVVTQSNTNFDEHQSSLCDLKRKVLANQKILLQEIASQEQLIKRNRSHSSESKKRKRSYLVPQQQKSQPQSSQHLKQSLDILLRQSQQHNRAKSNKGGRLRPEAKQTDDPRVFMSKSLHFMQSLAKKQQLVNQSQLLRHKPSETQHHKVGVDEDSSGANNNRRQKLQTSGTRLNNSQERKGNQGRSQSPPQPNMARIPKKKQYTKPHTSSHAQIFRDDEVQPAAAVAMQGQLIASGGQHLGAGTANFLRQQAAQGHFQSQSLIQGQHQFSQEYEQPQNQGEFSQEDLEVMRGQMGQPVQGTKQYSSTTVTREMHDQLKRQQQRLGLDPQNQSVDQQEEMNVNPDQGAFSKKDSRAKKVTTQQVRMLAKKKGGAQTSAYQQVSRSVPGEGHDSMFGRQGAMDGRLDDQEDSPLREMLEHQQEQLQFQQQQQQQQLELKLQQKLYMR